MSTRALVAGLLLGFAAALAPAPCLAQEEWGVHVSGAWATLVAGSSTGSGTTLGKPPEYTDMFDTGTGARIGMFRAFRSNMRWDAVLFYENFGGNPYVGDLFPEGAEFSDLSITGLAAGVKLLFREDKAFRVTALGHVGMASLSSVDVTVDGQEQPYWSSTRNVYFDLRVGIEYRFSSRVSFVADVGLESFGSPDPDGAAPVRADADEGSAYPVTFGLEILLN